LKVFFIDSPEWARERKKKGCLYGMEKKASERKDSMRE
jgi:hypothetical protein